MERATSTKDVFPVRLSPVTTIIEAYDITASNCLSSFSLPNKSSFLALGLGSKYK